MPSSFVQTTPDDLLAHIVGTLEAQVCSQLAIHRGAFGIRRGPELRDCPKLRRGETEEEMGDGDGGMPPRTRFSRHM